MMLRTVIKPTKIVTFVVSLLPMKVEGSSENSEVWKLFVEMKHFKLKIVIKIHDSEILHRVHYILQLVKVAKGPFTSTCKGA